MNNSGLVCFVFGFENTVKLYQKQQIFQYRQSFLLQLLMLNDMKASRKYRFQKVHFFVIRMLFVCLPSSFSLSPADTSVF